MFAMSMPAFTTKQIFWKMRILKNKSALSIIMVNMVKVGEWGSTFLGGSPGSLVPPPSKKFYPIESPFSRR